MSTKGKFDEDKLNIDRSLRKLCFHISKFNVTGCDLMMGHKNAMNYAFPFFLMGSSMNVKGLKEPKCK